MISVLGDCAEDISARDRYFFFAFAGSGNFHENFGE
jgi:hypothetical protein